MKLATLEQEREIKDPHAGVKVHADYAGPIRTGCDILVVGSGPGGAVVAKELAEAGRDVILVEEGPPFGAKDMRTDASQALRRLYREAGMRVMRGNVFTPTMQANALGGGSLVNSAISARAPGWALDKWADRWGLPNLSSGTLDPHYQSVENFLGIASTPTEVQGERNLLFKKGCDALGYSSEPTPRNVRACKGSGECFTGCRNGAKQSTDVSYVPAAIRAGARVLTSVRAEYLVMDGRRVRKVRGKVVAPFTGKESYDVEIDANVVVLAAGCMATPLILLKSGVGNESGQVGENLRAHPGLAVMGMFEHKVDPWHGATQGYHSLHFLKEGMKLEVLWAPPAILAVRLPGFGTEFKQHLMNFDHMAPFDVFIAGEHSRGSVKPKGHGWDPNIQFSLDPRDVKLMQRGVGILADICFAAGATAILPGIHGIPEVLKKEDLHVLRENEIRGADTTVGATHVFGSTRMGANPKESVVNADGRCHDVENLYVSDTGIFPDSTAVNPMLTCMALAHRIAKGIAAS